MTTERQGKHQGTQEERAYGRLLDEVWEVLSEPARTVLREAQSAAYATNLMTNYSFQPEEFDEAMEKMHVAAAELTDREHKLLARLWRAALGAAASVDPEDFEPLAGYRVYRGGLHHYYRMTSAMIEKTLEERGLAGYREEGVHRDQEWLPEIPF